jgi:hypothetical protein
MPNYLKHFVLVTIIATASVGVSAGVIVDLNANGSSNISNPFVINFQPGDIFILTPIGTAEGGAFDAYSFWNTNAGCDANGEDCVNGFHWVLAAIINGDTDPGSIGLFGIFGQYFATGAQALSNVQDAAVIAFGEPFFTIDTDQAGWTSVGLYITDIDYSDNRGGISFMYDIRSSVPIPATLALFGIGLAGLGWSRRKKF